MFNNYCLFAQAIHDTNRDEIVMYELLLRKFDGEKWVFPSNFFQSEELEERYPIFIDWLKLEIAKVLKKLDYAKVSLNINSNQLFYLETIKMFESLRVYKDLITIEITEDLLKIPFYKSHLTANELDAFLYGKLSHLKKMGYNIILDDVGCGINCLERTNYYLPLINGIKVSLKNFELSSMALFIEAWASYARQNNMHIILENVDQAASSLQLREMGLHLQQGFLLDEPALINQHVS